MPRLVLGPLLRHIGSTDATVWVETDAPCEVDVLGHRTETFHVAGHHYALVVLEGLEPGTTSEYEVRLDGERAWPGAHSPFPPSVIRTLDPDAPLTLLFGSCRVSRPHEPPYTSSPDEHEEGRGVDALRAFALRLAEEPPERLPDAVLMLGDQVYADEVSPETLAFIRSRRDPSEEPGEEVADFEEYTRLYRESWQEPVTRWFLSTVSSAMLFDDHDVHDDWNISHDWVERMRGKPWWDDRIAGAFASYWLYQHLGNLSPRELAQDRLWQRVREATDAAPLLREFALKSDREAEGKRWSFCRDFGRTRLLAIDCRAGRVLDGGRRSMVDREEWDWIVEAAQGDHEHLLLGMSDPYLLAPAIHHLQAWNEALCEGAWGRLFARAAEELRERLDLDHWASFRRSFERLTDLLLALGTGQKGGPPASIVALSGDVHNAYLAEVAFRRGSGMRSRVYQAVCSPIRNPLGARERRAQRLAASRGAYALARALAAAARVPSPRIRWRYAAGPFFTNAIGILRVEGRHATLTVAGAAADADGRPSVTTVLEHELV